MTTIATDELTRTPLSALWDTTRMRLLVEIDRQGSLSAAASAIGIGQSSVSEHLRLLELAAGQRLVERSGRGSSLTDAGRAAFTDILELTLGRSVGRRRRMVV